MDDDLYSGRIIFRQHIEHGFKCGITSDDSFLEKTCYGDTVRFLRRYRNLPKNDTIEFQLLYTFRALGPTTPQALLAASYWTREYQVSALPYFLGLLVKGNIGFQFCEPLTMRCEIWLNDDSLIDEYERTA